MMDKQKRRERDERRQVRRHKHLVATLKGEDGRKDFTPFTERDALTHFAKRYAIGWMKCPRCDNKKVMVFNEDGLSGKKSRDYLGNHNGKPSKFEDKAFCESASMRYVEELLNNTVDS